MDAERIWRAQGLPLTHRERIDRRRADARDADEMRRRKKRCSKAETADLLQVDDLGLLEHLEGKVSAVLVLDEADAAERSCAQGLLDDQIFQAEAGIPLGHCTRQR